MMRIAIDKVRLARWIGRLATVGTGALGSLMAADVDATTGGFLIASHGAAKAEILIAPERAEPPIIFAAEEFRRIVKAMSGAQLPIVRSPTGTPAVVLTRRGPAANPEATDPRDDDGYRVSADAKELRIDGASARAVLFGVYDVLERLGCGWCVPGDDAVPKRETLALASLSLETRPAFRDRMLLDFPLMTVAQTVAIADWMAKNRMNWVRECPNAHGEPVAWYERRERVVPELAKRGLRLIVGGHTMHTWVPETHATAHPEWFAIEKGERKPPTLCVSNLEMTAELLRNMQRFLDRCPEVDVIDLWHTDSEVFCHCPKCTRGVLSENVKTQSPAPPDDAVRTAYTISHVEWVNRVAESIARSHPKVMIGPLIYSQTDRAAPDGCPPLADNVLLGVAHFFRDSYRPLIGEPKSAINLRFLGNDLTWIAKAKHSYIYEYYNGWTAPYVYPGAQVIVRDLQTLRDLQVQGVSSDMYGYSPINMFVAARALWAPDVSWKEAVREFCLRYYGDVGAEMAENEFRLNEGIFGLAGYQANGARDPESPARPASGRYLEGQRSAQISFLEKMIAATKDPRVKERLQRALKPWTLWNQEPRFWAFPEFKDTK